MQVRAKCNGRAVAVEVAPGTSVETLALDLARAGGVPDAAPSTLKLIRRGGAASRLTAAHLKTWGWAHRSP